MGLTKSEIIIVPDEGYSNGIYKRAIKLHNKLNCQIIVSGADRNPETQQSYGLKRLLEKTLTPIPVYQQISKMLDAGVSKNAIIYESKSNNTKENAVNSLAIMKEKFPETRQIHLIGSLEGILRRYLTFKKTLSDFKIEAKISPSPTYDVFPSHLAFYRLILVPSEFLRIYRYRKMGDL